MQTEAWKCCYLHFLLDQQFYVQYTYIHTFESIHIIEALACENCMQSWSLHSDITFCLEYWLICKLNNNVCYNVIINESWAPMWKKRKHQCKMSNLLINKEKGTGKWSKHIYISFSHCICLQHKLFQSYGLSYVGHYADFLYQSATISQRHVIRYILNYIHEFSNFISQTAMHITIFMIRLGKKHMDNFKVLH